MRLVTGMEFAIGPKNAGHPIVEVRRPLDVGLEQRIPVGRRSDLTCRNNFPGLHVASGACCLERKFMTAFATGLSGLTSFTSNRLIERFVNRLMALYTSL